MEIKKGQYGIVVNGDFFELETAKIPECDDCDLKGYCGLTSAFCKIHPDFAKNPIAYHFKGNVNKENYVDLDLSRQIRFYAKLADYKVLYPNAGLDWIIQKINHELDNGK